MIEPDGTAHYDNGVVKNVYHRRYFKEAMNGQQTLSDPLESSVDQETRVVLGVPVYDNNQEVIGILGGSYNVTTLSHMLFDDLFDGEGDTLIVNHTGKIAFIESALDDPEHVSLDGYPEQLRGIMSDAHSKVKKLLDSSDNGKMLK